MKEITDFLNNNYVESESKDFRLAQNVEQIKWAYTVPNYKTEYFYCIRSTAN